MKKTRSPDGLLWLVVYVCVGVVVVVVVGRNSGLGREWGKG